MMTPLTRLIKGSALGCVCNKGLFTGRSVQLGFSSLGFLFGSHGRRDLAILFLDCLAHVSPFLFQTLLGPQGFQDPEVVKAGASGFDSNPSRQKSR